MPDEYLLKICIIGIPDELKTRMVRTFAEGKFTTDYLPSLGVDITTKQIQVDGNNIKLILVDTAGQEFFGKLRPSYYRGASACLIMFALNEKSSFDAIPDWLAEFRKHIPTAAVPITLVGVRSKSQKFLARERKQKKSLEKEIRQRKEKQTNWPQKIIQRFLNTIKFRKLKRSKKNRVGKLRKNKEKKDGKKVSPEEARNLAQELGINYFEVNDDDPLAIEEVFLQITRKILSKH